MLLSFWCSIASQSLEGILFASQSGIPTTRRQRLEDALLQILPVLNDSLSIKDVPEMAIGACMLTTILASRSALGDNVIAKLMDEIAVTWTPSTVDARLISLAALAQEMSTGKLSRAVTKRLVELPDLISHLVTISQSFKVDKLTAGLALRCIDRLPKSREADLELIQRALESRILKDKQVVKVLTNLFDAVSGLLKSGTGDVADEFATRLRNRISGIVASLSKSRYSSALSIAQSAAETSLHWRVYCRFPVWMTYSNRKTSRWKTHHWCLQVPKRQRSCHSSRMLAMQATRSLKRPTLLYINNLLKHSVAFLMLTAGSNPLWSTQH